MTSEETTMTMFCERFGPPIASDTDWHDGSIAESRNRAAGMMDAGGLSVIQLAAEGIAEAMATRMMEDPCECEVAEYDSRGNLTYPGVTCSHHGDRYCAILDRLRALALRRICRRGSMFSGLGRSTLERLAVELDAAMDVTK